MASDAFGSKGVDSVCSLQYYPAKTVVYNLAAFYTLVDDRAIWSIECVYVMVGYIGSLYIVVFTIRFVWPGYDEV